MLKQEPATKAATLNSNVSNQEQVPAANHATIKVQVIETKSLPQSSPCPRVTTLQHYCVTTLSQDRITVTLQDHGSNR